MNDTQPLGSYQIVEQLIAAVRSELRAELITEIYDHVAKWRDGLDDDTAYIDGIGDALITIEELRDL